MPVGDCAFPLRGDAGRVPGVADVSYSENGIGVVVRRLRSERGWRPMPELGPPMDRRTFIQSTAIAGGGLLLSIYVGACRGDEAMPTFRPNAFLRIDPDGSVTVTVSKQEMGQGVRTSLAMVMADELGAEWSRVRVEQADLDEVRYGPQYTGGSSSVRSMWGPLRAAAATTRAMLATAAAARWSVPVSDCHAAGGAVTHPPSGRRLEFPALVAAAAKLPVPTEAALKDPSEFRIVGRAVPQVDIPAIVSGTMTYGLDVRVPGMLHAVIERSPVFGGRVRRVDDAAARAVPGVRAVVTVDADAIEPFGENNPKMAKGVAVVATSTWEAIVGRRALRVEWDNPGAPASTDAMRAQAAGLARRPGRWRYRDDGDIDAGLRGAARVIEAVYEVPLLAHAQMEPMNAVADVRADAATVWAPCQEPAGVRTAVAKVTGLAPGTVTVHPVRMGGGFGRRFYADYAAEAAYVSRAVGAPVQVVWTREDDMRHGFYRPAGYQRLRGGLDAGGRVVVWHQHLVNASRGHYMAWTPPPGKELQPGEVGRDDFPASFIPNLRVEYTPLDSPIPRGQWRAVEESMNVFVNQGFLAELANAAGKDPLTLNLEMLAGGPRQVSYYGGSYDARRLAAVFEAAANRSGWGTPLPRGWGRGIAGSYSNGAFVAQVAEVEMRGGRARVHRVVAAVDCGFVVNPSGVTAQVEGGILFGLSAALKQEITVAGGRVVQGNFDDYPALRMSEVPRVEVHLLPSAEPPSGVGECAVGQVAPAVTEAIFRAGGGRIRRLPIRAGL